MANRPKLTIEDQVAYMKNKGITFDHCSEKDAVRFLQESTYFFKVKAFDKNYIAHPKTGHYYNLDFSYLMELSTLDMRLRRLILHATLDIEHFLKVQLRVDLSRVNSAKCSKLINCYLSLFINNKGLPIDTAAPSACRETRFIVQSWTGFLAYNSQIRIM